MEDMLFIGYSDSTKDKACLVIARRQGRGYKIIRTLYGVEAVELYAVLKGEAK